MKLALILLLTAFASATQAQSLNEPRAAEYAANARRCEDAMWLAELCGKFAGKFSCDAKGFVPVSIAAGGRRAPAMSAGEAFRMERCALQAAQGGD